MLEIILLKIPFITVLASVVIIIPITVGMITFKYWVSTPIKIVFIYSCIYALLECIAWYYVLNHKQNHFLVNTIAYTDVLFWSYYFHCIIKNLHLRKAIITSAIVTILLIAWSNFSEERDYNRIDSFAQSVSNICLIAISLFFFYQLLNQLDVKNLFLYPYFWIGVGVLIYFSGIFFVNIFAEFITFNKDKAIIQFWNSKDYLLFFHRIFLALGLWFSRTPIQSNLSSK
jgi:hypothetical protein